MTMQKHIKKFLAIILSAVVLMSCIGWQLFTVAASDVLFEDDFSSSSLPGWSVQNIGTVKDGVYTLDGTEANLMYALGEVSNVAISADIKVNPASNGFISNGMATIVFHASDDMTKGYEFGIGVLNDGTAYAILYRNGVDEITLKKAELNIPGTDSGKVEMDTVYRIKVIEQADSFSCYINDELFHTSYDKTYTKGYVGVSTWNAKGAFDNVTVRTIGEKKIESISLQNVPTELTIAGAFDLDILVKYSGVWGTQKLSANSAGVQISGFDGKTGKKTFTVSYGGKSVKFQANVLPAPTKDDLLIFKDSFENFDGWRSTIGTMDPLEKTWNFTASGGKLVAKYPDNASGFDANSNTSAIVTDTDALAKAKKQRYYTISVESQMLDIAKTATERRGFNDIYFAKGEKTYRFRIQSNGVAYILADSTNVASKTITGYVMGQKENVEIVVRDNVVTCYFNGKQILTYDKIDAAAEPNLRITSINATMSYDNYAVSLLENKSKWAAKSFKIINKEGDVVTSHTGKTFNPSLYSLQVTYLDGSVFEVPMDASMLEGYDASTKESQKITVRYGKKTANFTVNYTKHLYYNSFDQNSLSGLSVSGEAYQIAVKNKMLQVDFDLSKAGLTNKDALIKIDSTQTNPLQDVVVSMDFCMLNGNNLKDQYITMSIRGGTGNTSYEFRLKRGKTGLISVEFLRRTPESAKVIGSWPQASIVSMMQETDETFTSIDTGIFYNLRLEAIESQFYCYFENKLLGIISDKNNSVDSGYVRISSRNVSAKFDNIYVDVAEPRTAQSITIDGLENGVYNTYQGFEIEPDDLTLNIIYSDGYVSTTPIWEDYIVKNYDPNVLGKQTVNIDYNGIKYNFDVNVSDRPAYIDKFKSMVKALDKNKLTADDKTAIYALRDYYLTLSPYESNALGSLYNDYCDLTDAFNRVLYKEAKDAPVYYDEFNNPDLEGSVWTKGLSGGYNQRNGYIICERVRRGSTGSGSSSNLVADGIYTKTTMVEADICMAYPGSFAALMLNYGKNGYYQIRITNKYTDSNNQPITTLQLYKATNVQKNLASVYPSIKGVDIGTGDWVNMKVTFDDGFIAVYLDDVLMLSYDDSSSATCMREGSCGFRNSEMDAKFANFRVYGEVVESTNYTKVIEPTVYTDDFEDETVGQSASHWTEAAKQHLWKVYNKGGSKVLGTISKTASYTYVHSFEENPDYTAKFMVASANANGKAGILTHTGDETVYTAVGYDFAAKKWFIASTNGSDFETQIIYADATSSFETGKWYDLHLKSKGKSLSMTVDGTKVLDTTVLQNSSFGRFGVFSSGAETYIDDVKYISENGTNYNNGVIELTNLPTVYFGSLDIEDLGNGLLIGGNSNRILRSDDYGESWTEVKSGEDYYDTRSNSYNSILRISGNKYIKLAMGTTDVYVSNDGMKSWTLQSTILQENERYDEWGNNLVTIHVNSFTKITRSNGQVRIFLPIALRRYNMKGSMLGHYSKFYYSDDEGKTWQCSEDDTREVMPYFKEDDTSTFTEGKIIKCSDGSIRYYQTRNNIGCVIYMESKDEGETWTEFGHIPYMQCPMGSYGIDEDPNNPGTYYMAWVSSQGYSFGATFPRIRLSLAKTTDGKNWEFVTDVDRTSALDSDYASEIRQFIDPSVTVSDDYIYVNLARCTSSGDEISVHNAVRQRVIRLEKANLTTRPWDDATVTNTMFPVSIEIGTSPQTKFGYADLFSTLGGTVKVTTVNGSVYEDPLNYYELITEPNMFNMGKQTVRFVDVHQHILEYDIEVVPNYNLNWTIKGKGTVDPNPDATLRMMEGAEQTFTLMPNKGYKVSYVTVNGKKVNIRKNTFTISNVQEDQDITVSFVKLGFVDYLPWIILAVVVVAGIGIGVVLLLRKKKKTPKEIEDISSTSNNDAENGGINDETNN